MKSQLFPVKPAICPKIGGQFGPTLIIGPNDKALRLKMVHLRHADVVKTLLQAGADISQAMFAFSHTF